MQFTRSLIAGSLLALILGGCDSGPDTAVMPKMAVQVAEAEQRDFPLSIDLTGSTYGNQDVPIRARVEGFLLTVDFREGRMVNEGDLLYTIDPEPFQAKVLESQSALAAERTKYVKAQADLERIRPLAEMRAVSEQELDAAVAQEAASKASVQAAEARLDLSNIELGYTKMYAPIDGLIGLTKARPGEFVGREPNPVVLNTLSDIDPIRVRFSISEREYLELADRCRKTEAGESHRRKAQRQHEQINRCRCSCCYLTDPSTQKLVS